jgi:hypothetical protein
LTPAHQQSLLGTQLDVSKGRTSGIGLCLRRPGVLLVNDVGGSDKGL